MKKVQHYQPIFLPWRFRFVFLFFLTFALILVARMVYLTTCQRTFLLTQGNSRSLRVISTPAYRGMILDRNGEPLAVSTPVDSVWVNPQEFQDSYQNIFAIAKILQIPSESIQKILKANADKQFTYLKRDATPDQTEKLKTRGIPGIYWLRDYKRYYPTGEITSHVLGRTDIDEIGIDGLELAYNQILTGQPGKIRALKDLYGNVVAVLEELQPALPGKDVYLSIDNRIQFLAYRVLKETVNKYHAASGSVVVMNPKTGEVLAMVNQPSFNPNNRPKVDRGQFRNRAVTDMFEPGSTIKVFTIINALESKKYTTTTLVNTNPGWFKVGKNIITDNKHINNGVMTVTQVLQKSSDIGVSKISLSLSPQSLLDVLERVGFNRSTQSGFPGETAGRLNLLATTRPFVLATVAFGYGIAVTTLQLAHAYSTIANHGQQCPVTLLKSNQPLICPTIFSPKISQQVLQMMETVLQTGGTGVLGNVPGYHVAGKTGTAHMIGMRGYEGKKYVSSFVGIAPSSDPQLVVAVVIQDPQGEYYGGLVAAPAFSEIMGNALRLLNIPPDAIKMVQAKQKTNLVS